jgi:tRNA threonylcarbamoyladenosine biosynthesis protein TsaE
MRLTTASEEDTRLNAAKFASTLAAGSVLLLSGDLGSGKTAFVRGVAQGLGIDPDEVTSPTFTLVHEYRGGRVPLVHVDLYRLEQADLDEIGLDPDLASRGVLAIEWGERLTRAIDGSVRIRIADEGGDRRSITIDAPTRDDPSRPSDPPAPSTRSF